MLKLMLALSVATVLTSIFTFRFSAWKRPRLVLLYFACFLLAELIAEFWLIPEGAFGPGLSLLCFAISIPFIVASLLLRRSHLKAGLDWSADAGSSRREPTNDGED